jgi:hypothetical protein
MDEQACGQLWAVRHEDEVRVGKDFLGLQKRSVGRKRLFFLFVNVTTQGCDIWNSSSHFNPQNNSQLSSKASLTTQQEMGSH